MPVKACVCDQGGVCYQGSLGESLLSLSQCFKICRLPPPVWAVFCYSKRLGRDCFFHTLHYGCFVEMSAVSELYL
jgi:hypothetical protein